MERLVQGNVLTLGDGRAVAGVVVDIYETDADPNGAIDLGAAERLASVVTDTAGRFSFSWDDPARVRDNGGQRQLVVAVYSGRETGGRRRVRKPMVLSNPRAGAGLRDDFMLHVDERTLAREGITVERPGSGKPRQLPEDQFAGHIDLRTAARKTRTRVAGGEVRRRLKVRDDGVTLARRLLGKKPKTGRTASGRFVGTFDDPKEKLDEAREAGLARLNGLPLKGATVHLSEGLPGRLGIDEAALKDGSVSLPATAAKALLAEMAPSGSVERLSWLLDQCRARREARVLAATSDTGDTNAGSSDASDGGDGGTASTEDTPAADVQWSFEQILQQIFDQVQARTETSISDRADMAAIAAELQKEVPLGPADTPAFYDFHQVQVAWQDTWTAVLDRLTETQVTELYESIVEVMDWPEIGEDMSEIDELETLLNRLDQAVQVATTTPGFGAPADLVAWVGGLQDVWTSLTYDEQEWMWFLKLYDKYADVAGIDIPFINEDAVARAQFLREAADAGHPQAWVDGIPGEFDEGWGAEQAEAFIDGLGGEDNIAAPSLGRARDLLEGIAARMSEPYQFDVFVPNSYNFGIMTTYRQRWKPLTYQVGELVSSIPLAPNEKRKFVKKQVVKTRRSQKEIEKALSSQRGEYTTTGRAEAEIVERAQNQSNFAMNADGTFSLGIVDITAGSEFGADQARESARTKTDIREATRTSAQEYGNERTLEVSLDEETTGEFVEEGEISNPNNELTVTYLFYELQRRYRVSERLNKISPVVMVAFEVPSPDQIDEDWLLTHEWVLRRMILDDGLLEALDYLSETFTGDEVGVEILRVQWEAQIDVVASLRDNVAVQARLRDLARDSINEATQMVADKEGVVKNLLDLIIGEHPDENDKEVIAARTEAAQRVLEWAEGDFTNAESKLQSAAVALRQATTDYLDAVQSRLNRRTAIDQLRMHVKANILHYMQAIWAHEHPDQRYFRLYDLEIRWPEPGTSGYTLTATSLVKKNFTPPGFNLPGQGGASLMFPKVEFGEERLLHEVADLDNLLGFKGNYGIFALKENNAITNTMAQDFLDTIYGLGDPDPMGEMPTTDEAQELVECVWNHAGTTDDDREALTEWLIDVLANQHRISEEIIVPTGQLYIEALPGSTPLLEDFKLRHRQLDLAKAETAITFQELEVLRRALRLAEGDKRDPDVDRSIEINAPVVPAVSVDPDSGGGA